MFPTPRLPTGIMSTVYRIDKAEGTRDYDNGGKYISGVETKTPFQGCIFPLTEDDLKYDEGGTYKTTDKKLYIHTQCKTGQEIESKGIRYTIQGDLDHGSSAVFYRYIVRRVGAVND